MKHLKSYEDFHYEEEILDEGLGDIIKKGLGAISGTVEYTGTFKEDEAKKALSKLKNPPRWLNETKGDMFRAYTEAVKILKDYNLTCRTARREGDKVVFIWNKVKIGMKDIGGHDETGRPEAEAVIEMNDKTKEFRQIQLSDVQREKYLRKQ